MSIQLRLGSRDSELALTQTRLVEVALMQAWPSLRAEIRPFKTQGDLILDTALSKVGDKGLFVKELEIALLQGEIDLAIHSMKDMPGELPEGLALQSALRREDARDVLLSRTGERFEDLPPGAVVGTSSLRREAQLRRRRPDLNYQTIRGNLQTRYRKLQEGPYQAIVLAAAGIHRLGWQDRISQYFDLDEQLPAVCQGILGVEFRLADCVVREYLPAIQHAEVEAVVRAERTLLQGLQGGCQLPLGGHARPLGEDRFQLNGIVLSPDGSLQVTGSREFTASEADAAGRELAEELLKNGAREILASLRATASFPE